MSFVVPQMPLSCNIWLHFQPGVSTYASPDVTISCNLTPGKRVFMNTDNLRIYSTDGRTVFGQCVELLLPKLGQISAGSPAKTPSVVEVVPGSQRMYWVVYVDDVGKGFANEHRMAVMRMINEAALPFSDVSLNVPPAVLP